MKNPSKSLFQLMKSLSKSEKRYLKLGLTGKETEHLRLFDAIQQQDFYDEEKLKLRYKGEAFTKNMAVYKSYLYRHILDKLSKYHQNSPQAEVFEKIRFAEILIAKKLFSAAKKQLIAAQKKAQKYQLPEMLLSVLKLQKELLVLTEKSNFQGIQKIYITKQETIKTLDLNTKYATLFNEISHLQIKIQKAKKPDEITKMERWRTHPLLNVNIKTLSLENSILYLKSIAIYHFTKGETLEASRYNQQLLTLLKSEPSYNEQNPEQYISILNNYIIDQLTLKNIAAFELGLQLLEKMPKDPAFQQVKNIKVRIFYQRYLLLFNYCFSERNYQKAMEEMPHFKDQLSLFEGQLQKHQLLTLQYLAAVLNFGAKNYQRAQVWLIPILQQTKEDVVQEIFRYARLLNLFIHLELENDEFVSTLLPAVARALSKQHKISPSEKLILQYIRKAISTTGRKEKHALKTNLLDQLEGLKELRLFNYLPVFDWLG